MLWRGIKAQAHSQSLMLECEGEPDGGGGGEGPQQHAAAATGGGVAASLAGREFRKRYQTAGSGVVDWS